MIMNNLLAKILLWCERFLLSSNIIYMWSSEVHVIGPNLQSASCLPYVYNDYISQLIRYARACSSYECFILQAVRLSNMLLGQVYVKERLKSSLRKFYGRYGDLTKQYEVSFSRMVHGILEDGHIQWHPPLMRHYTNFWPFADLDLITEFDLLPYCVRFP